ncbi:DUF4917 family protein [Legionella pneumophila]|uniref:DUF4917 domain-containing protein n=1 Tax=Legionella pneumophila subsp. pascullei TaxID=91890 RepID=A0AAX2IVR4_LEGPN|nr:DUF4917 family protein [Legionella pneumophila]AMP90223.1 hypothetical protein AXF35_11210 [Legionella pneumophila subsp. pascullei]AMP92110.1 hypothetical protein AXF36_05590 [Legionella pneumophila subsp. pascullei]AMP95075.1 hypothetical protein AXF37_05480 [Legionella pneumophila subsp. pascullei]SQG89948.1 Uncharacterised protein [Legionella pneumophila subsp. pascullei]VEH05731.1 Uncharacterised protein [Legionella pneumophila subsp. pascullei]
MAELKVISFEEALNKTNNRTILLGNGFSISLCEEFNYKNLYNKSQELSGKEGKPISNDMKKIFDALNTDDFEKVLAHLNITIEIAKHYSNSKLLLSTIKNDRKNLIASFLNTISSVHPRYKASIEFQTYVSCLRLLSKFSKIFTTNYDLLLYWIIMERNSPILSLFELKDFDISTLPTDDGFSRGKSTNGLLLWKPEHNYREQQIFYLHGSLFIIEIDDFYLKIESNNEGYILDQLESSLISGQQPLIVLEGSSAHKADKIGGHSYLRYCLDALKNLKGDLFLLGFSINDKSDKHIIESIQESEIKRIFVGCYSAPNENFKKNIKQLAHINDSAQERELFIFNSNEAVDWKPIKLKDGDA